MYFVGNKLEGSDGLTQNGSLHCAESTLFFIS